MIVAAWAEKEPTAAFDWARAHGLSLLDGMPQSLRNSIAEKAPIHMWETNGNPLTTAMRQKPDATLAWVLALPAGAERERYLAFIVGNLDAAKAKPLLAELPPDAAAHIARQLSQDIDKAREWTESLPVGPMREQAWAALGATRANPLALPPGPDRDAMLRGFASAWVEREPAKSLDRVLEIADPALRRRTFDDVFWTLHRGPIDLGHGISTGGASEASIRTASEWLEKANVPEDWKREWRK